jgi:transposase-like protein
MVLQEFIDAEATELVGVVRCERIESRTNERNGSRPRWTTGRRARVDPGISKSEVSRICAGLDELVTAFRTGRLDRTDVPYVDLDATHLHVRNATSQMVSMTVVVATGITADGGCEVLGLDVGDSEDAVFWRFLTAK